MVLVDGRPVDAQSVLTAHARYAFRLGAPVGRGRHDVRVVWYDGAKAVRSLERRLG